MNAISKRDRTDGLSGEIGLASVSLCSASSCSERPREFRDYTRPYAHAGAGE
jgi:hypothetical protein